MTEPTTSVATQGNALITGLEWIYNKVAGSFPAMTGMATDREIDTWITLACAGAGTAGFVTNLGGAFTLPVAVPANLISTATIQLTLVARIVAARGYDPASTEVRTFAIACLAGTKATEIVSGAGVKLGMKLAQTAVNQVAGATLTRINQAVGFRLLAKAGQQGVVNLTKLIPIAGGIVGGGIDAASTLAVGKAAKQLFPRIAPALPPTLPPTLAVVPEPLPASIPPALLAGPGV